MDIKSMLPESLKDLAPVLQGILDAAKDQTAVTQLKSDLEAKLTAIKSLPEGIDVAKMREDLQSLVTGFSELQAKMPKQGRDIEPKAKGLAAAIKEAYEAKKGEIDAILKAGGNQTAPLVLDVKDAIVMGEGNTIGSGATQYTLTSNTGIISPIRKRVERYFAGGVSVGTIDSLNALWVEETDEQGNPIFIAEGNAKTQLSVKYVEKTESVKKIAVYGKVTTEMLADLPQLVSYIQTNLMRRVDVATETQLFTGNGVGLNLKGAATYASSFTGGGLAGSIAKPNDFDVINAIAAQVSAANGVTTGVYVATNVKHRMLSNKTTDGQYLLPAGVTVDAAGNLSVFGIPIIETNALANDNFIGGDLSVLNVRFRQGMTMQIGLDGNDFTNNVKTILVEQRLVQFVSANDTQVLVKGTFAVAKGVIDSGS